MEKGECNVITSLDPNLDCLLYEGRRERRKKEGMKQEGKESRESTNKVKARTVRKIVTEMKCDTLTSLNSQHL